jgi:predicted site-specific integrase-resolvase
MTIELPAPTYSVAQCSKILNVYRTSTYRYIRSGALEASRDDTGQLRVSKESLYHFLKTREQN